MQISLMVSLEESKAPFSGAVRIEEDGNIHNVAITAGSRDDLYKRGKFVAKQYRSGNLTQSKNGLSEMHQA